MAKPLKLTLFILLFPLIPLFGQQSPYLDYIQISEQNGKVFLQWVMSTGAICDGIDVYRSSDAELFERVGRIPGICGSPDFAVGFDFVDEDPMLNQVNHYRLEMGNLGVSPVVSILVLDYRVNQFQIIPHPLQQEGKLYFKHTPGERHRLLLFDLQGKIVMENESSEGAFVISADQLNAGIYFIYIKPKKNGTAITGKMVVSN